jgi:hypothetical protein
MKYTIKDVLDVLDNLTLRSKGGQLRKFFPEPDPKHLEELRIKIMKRIEEEDQKVSVNDKP